nr:reverse transcriptase domain-containing protein [Tanacetum cinerariifolium]
MMGLTSEPVTPVNQATRNNDNPNNSPSLQDQILDHVSSLKALIKQHNERCGTLIEPIRLSFGDEDGSDKGKGVDKGDEDAKDEDLQKPYKEVLKSPFTWRIIEFSAPKHREWQMLVWCRMFKHTLDGLTRGWFDRMPNGCIDNLVDLREKFIERFALRRRCFKDPTKVSKIIRRASEMLTDFKERWTAKMSYIQDVPEVMGAADIMLYEQLQVHRDYYQPYVLPRANNRRYDNRRHENNHLSMDALTKRPKEILATKLQLQLPPCPPMVGAPKKENLDRYCDYH